MVLAEPTGEAEHFALVQDNRLQISQLCAGLSSAEPDHWALGADPNSSHWGWYLQTFRGDRLLSLPRIAEAQLAREIIVPPTIMMWSHTSEPVHLIPRQ